MTKVILCATKFQIPSVAIMLSENRLYQFQLTRSKACQPTDCGSCLGFGRYKNRPSLGILRYEDQHIGTNRWVKNPISIGTQAGALTLTDVQALLCTIRFNNSINHFHLAVSLSHQDQNLRPPSLKLLSHWFFSLSLFRNSNAKPLKPLQGGRQIIKSLIIFFVRIYLTLC